MRKVMLSVAPVSASATQNDPRAIAADVVACWRAGAAMVHLHCRDAYGRLTDDVSLLAETVGLIRAQCPIIIQVSTGGVSNLTIEQRCRPCAPAWVECNSLNVGSVNLGDAVYRNPMMDVRYCVQQILANGKVPEIEVFEIGMIHTARVLARQFAFAHPLLFALVVGHPGAMPATEAALDLMIRGLYTFYPEEANTLWGITEANRTDWRLIDAALDSGASTVRIGFEDSDSLGGRERAPHNAALVAALAERVKAKGLLCATPDEARQMIGCRRGV
jgi:3-keto-5-aminohexanoate cleavage enzyme